MTIPAADLGLVVRDVAATSELPPAPPAPPPDRTLYAERAGRTVARAALWTRGPDWAGRTTGLIGGYAALDDAAGAFVLRAAAAHLRAAGRDLAVGPLDGSTWFSYRLVTEEGAEPPFLLEPRHVPGAHTQWTEAGFTPLLTYSSALATPDTHHEDVRAAELRRRHADVTVRPAHPDRIEADLAAIYDVSVRSFARNPFYTPLSRDAFGALYRPLLSRVDLDWVWLADRAGETVGYVFAVPDPRPGPLPATLVVKTVAVLPGRAHAGLGRHLVGEVHRRAFAAGFTRVVHALMHDGNDSLILSRRLGATFRRYALLARDLRGDES